MRTLNFVPKCTQGPLEIGLKFVFNNQTALILLLLVKTVCGIDLLSFNKILWCTQIILIVWSTGMKICLMGCLYHI